ncbi:hypothetical protein [Haloferax sp. DFSO60]|uniref:hypothetical protein n=1 Tax=Haloferax sp. DFSO60 TaxID=3388652 RepID=UPI00397AFD6B
MPNSSDIPDTLSETLVATLSEAREGVRSGDVATAREQLDIAAQIIRSQLPESSVTETLTFGLTAVERTAADEPLVASEYLRSMIELLEE